MNGGYRFSPVLFTQADGAPFEFYMRSCPEKNKLEPLIESGGALLHSCYRPGRIRLVEPGSKVMYLKEGEEALSVQFIYDCVKRNSFLDMKNYRVKLKSMETSDISEDSGSLKGDRTVKQKSKQPSRTLKPINDDVKKNISLFILENKADFLNMNDLQFSNKIYSDNICRLPPEEIAQSLDSMLISIDLLPVSGDFQREMKRLVLEKVDKEFSRSDDLNILSYIFVNACNDHNPDRNVWEQMKSDLNYSQPARSLWYRFQEIILPNINNYSLAPFKVQEIVSKAESLSLSKLVMTKARDPNLQEPDGESIENSELVCKKPRYSESVSRDIIPKSPAMRNRKTPRKSITIQNTSSPRKQPARVAKRIAESIEANEKCIPEVSNQSKAIAKSQKMPVVVIKDCFSHKKAHTGVGNGRISLDDFSQSPTCISETPEAIMNGQTSKNQSERVEGEVKKQASLESSSDLSAVPPTYLQSQGKSADSQPSAVSSDRTVSSLNEALINDTGSFTPSFECNKESIEIIQVVPYAQLFGESHASNKSESTQIGNRILPIDAPVTSSNIVETTDLVLVPSTDSVSPIAYAREQQQLEKLQSSANSVSTVNEMSKPSCFGEILNSDQKTKDCAETTEPVFDPDADGELCASVSVSCKQGNVGKKGKSWILSEKSAPVVSDVIKKAMEPRTFAHSSKVTKMKSLALSTKSRNLPLCKMAVDSQVDDGSLSNSSRESSALDDLEGLKKFLNKNHIEEQYYPSKGSNNPQKATIPFATVRSVDELDILKSYVNENLREIEEMDQVLAKAEDADVAGTSDQSQLTLTSSEGEVNVTAVRIGATSDRRQLVDHAAQPCGTPSRDAVDEGLPNVVKNNGAKEPRRNLMDNTIDFYTPNTSPNQSVISDAVPEVLPHQQNINLRDQSLSSLTSGFRTADETLDDDAMGNIRSCDATPVNANDSGHRATSPSLISQGNGTDWNSMEVHPPMSTLASDVSTEPIEEDDDRECDIAHIFPSSRNSINAGSQLEIIPENLQAEQQEDSPIPQDIDPFASSAGSQFTGSTQIEADIPIATTEQILNEAASIVRSFKDILSTLKNTVPKSTVTGLKRRVEKLGNDVYFSLLQLKVREISKKPKLSLEDKCTLAKYFSIKKNIPYNQFLCDIVNRMHL